MKLSSSDPGITNAWLSNGTSTADIMLPNGVNGVTDYGDTSYGYGINHAGTVAGYCNSTTLSAGPRRSS